MANQDALKLQVERYKFALQMCLEHAKQADKTQACETIIQQIEAVFCIEASINGVKLLELPPSGAYFYNIKNTGDY